MKPIEVVSGVVIAENEVGIVIKKFSPNSRHSSLQPHKLIALNGEAGCQADTLSPGLYLGYYPWMYTIVKEPVIYIPAGEIGLVVANDGASIPRGRILGKVVDCDNFQDARAFLENGGEKGRQLGILTTGKYRINTKLFTVITTANAAELGIDPKDLRVYKVEADKIGIVTTYDGTPIKPGEIAGSPVTGHENFQNGQNFIDCGGCKGLQEEVLPPGAWNLNPWFVNVEQVAVTHIPAGTVGVVISHIGKIPQNDVGDNPVEAGYKGVQKIPLYPGKYPINTRVMNVVLVPTHQITLDWTKQEKPPTNYDANLGALNLRSKDGFPFRIEVTQVISIAGKDAPRMISRVGSIVNDVSEPTSRHNSNLINSVKFGSIKNLVTRVLEPMVGNHFRNSAYAYNALEFHNNRIERQREAVDHIKPALSAYGVQAMDTFIHEIDLTENLEKIVTDRTIAEELSKTYQLQKSAEEQRLNLVRATAEADIQQELVSQKNATEMAKRDAQARLEQAKAEAESIRIKGEAEADANRAQVNAVGRQEYAAIKIVEAAAKGSVPLVPQIVVNNNDGNNSGLAEGLMGKSPTEQFILPHLLQNSARIQPVQSIPLDNLPPSAALPQRRIVCTNCGTENPAIHKFCSTCGTSLTSESKAQSS